MVECRSDGARGSCGTCTGRCPGESKYRFVTENVDDVVWTADMSLRFTYVSPSVTAMHGYSPDELIGRSVGVLMSGESTDVVAAAFWRGVKRSGSALDAKRSVTLELEGLRRDGSVVWTEVRVGFYRDGRGNPAGVLGVTRDVTERRRLQGELLEKNKLAAIGQLAAGVAHELNTPLATVNVVVEALLLRIAAGGTPDAGLLGSKLAVIGKQVGRMVRIVGDLLQFSRRISLKRERVDIRDVIRGVLDDDDVGPRIVGLGIAVDVGPGGPSWLSADGEMLYRVFRNVISNAIDALAAVDGHGRRIAIAAKEAGGTVEITVADTGCGVGKGDLERAFEPFFTTKGTGNGTGLGLPICRGIVEKHGGTMLLESETGAGTVVTVRLPAAPRNP